MNSIFKGDVNFSVDDKVPPLQDGDISIDSKEISEDDVKNRFINFDDVGGFAGQVMVNLRYYYEFKLIDHYCKNGSVFVHFISVKLIYFRLPPLQLERLLEMPELILPVALLITAITVIEVNEVY